MEVPPDYGGGGGSPGSPEMHHCSSTTQPLGTPEVYTPLGVTRSLDLISEYERYKVSYLLFRKV